MQRRFWISKFSFALAAICFIDFFIPSPLKAADAPAAKKIATVEGITEYQLDNGLRVLLFPDPSTSAVTVNLTVLVGSRHEGYGETGMAHLLEHMLFKGCPKFPNVPKALRDHGGRFKDASTAPPGWIAPIISKPCRPAMKIWHSLSISKRIGS